MIIIVPLNSCDIHEKDCPSNQNTIPLVETTEVKNIPDLHQNLELSETPLREKPKFTRNESYPLPSDAYNAALVESRNKILALEKIDEENEWTAEKLSNTSSTNGGSEIVHASDTQIKSPEINSNTEIKKNGGSEENSECEGKTNSSRTMGNTGWEKHTGITSAVKRWKRLRHNLLTSANETSNEKPRMIDVVHLLTKNKNVSSTDGKTLEHEEDALQVRLFFVFPLIFYL